eukprot:Transcript_12939.p1 GENE.Transcript_12939~~Transcript_12939.p1  ORF type:complete len:635 (-),score=268.02 Transcript_12939:83-1987(-)
MEGAQWVEEPWRIVKHYATGWFLLDLISILPVEFLTLKPAGQSEVEVAEESESDLSALKLLRVIRLLRLIKLIRLVRGARILKRWESQVAINYSTLTLVMCLVFLLMSAHWFACVWALQVSLAADTPVDSWMGHYGYCWPDPEHKLGYDCVAPGSRYSVCVYFAVMTITSIGYGDIAATPKLPSEQIVATLLMLVGSMMWAYIIGTFCGMIATMNPSAANFRNTIDDLNRFMKLQDLEPEMRRRLREYFHQTKHLQIALANRKLLARMSPSLAGEVAVKTSERWLKRIWFLQNVDAGFMAQLAMRLEPMVFAPAELAPVGKLYICHRGVALYGGKLLTAGRVWGEDMILESVHLIRPYSARAMNYLECYSITKDDLLTVAANFPGMLRHIRNCAIRLALIREVVRLAREKQDLDDPESADQRRRSNQGSFGGALETAASTAILADRGGKSVVDAAPTDDGGRGAAPGSFGGGSFGMYKQGGHNAEVPTNSASSQIKMLQDAEEAREAYKKEEGSTGWGSRKSGRAKSPEPKPESAAAGGGSTGGGGGGGGGGGIDTVLRTRVDGLASEVAGLRDSIHGIETLLRAALQAKALGAGPAPQPLAAPASAVASGAVAASASLGTSGRVKAAMQTLEA